MMITPSRYTGGKLGSKCENTEFKNLIRFRKHHLLFQLDCKDIPLKMKSSLLVKKVKITPLIPPLKVAIGNSM